MPPPMIATPNVIVSQIDEGRQTKLVKRVFFDSKISDRKRVKEKLAEEMEIFSPKVVLF